MLRQQANRIYHHVEGRDPACNDNPPMIPFMWLNSVSGELFSCLRNAAGENVWQGQAGTFIGTKFYSVDFEEAPLVGWTDGDAVPYLSTNRFHSGTQSLLFDQGAGGTPTYIHNLESPVDISSGGVRAEVWFLATAEDYDDASIAFGVYTEDMLTAGAYKLNPERELDSTVHIYCPTTSTAVGGEGDIGYALLLDKWYKFEVEFNGIGQTDYARMYDTDGTTLLGQTSAVNTQFSQLTRIYFSEATFGTGWVIYLDDILIEKV